MRRPGRPADDASGAASARCPTRRALQPLSSLRRACLLTVVGLAAADSAIVVLALPQLLVRFGKSIPSTAWVVTSYNLAAAVAGLAVVLAARRLQTKQVLVAGLLVFGVASVGCAVSTSLLLLVVLRAAQGLGGALTLTGALAELGAGAWAGAAAVGAAAGPALGGALTEAFDWRAIFVVQAPVAFAALVAAAGIESLPVRQHGLGRLPAAAALALISGALVGALFLAVVLLVEAHSLSPIRAAAMVTLLPVAALAVRRLAPTRLLEVGVIVLAAGLGLLALAPQSLVVDGIALAACGAGLGLCLPPTTGEAGAIGVAARHAGVVLGLLLLAPLLSNGLSAAEGPAKDKGIALVFHSNVPFLDKIPLSVDLYRHLKSAGHGKLPDFTSAFAKAKRRDAGAADQLDSLQRALNQLERNAIAGAFRRPFGVAAILALCSLAPLGARRLLVRQ